MAWRQSFRLKCKVCGRAEGFPRSGESVKERGFSSPRRLHLFAKASPFEERLPPRRGKMSRSDKRGNLPNKVRLRGQARDPNAIHLFRIQKLCYTVLNRRNGRAFVPSAAKREFMEHRIWNKNNIRTSLLGYGCMRFPTKADGTIDEERAEALLNTAKAAGVNYFDTAYPYHNGQSEPFVGRVIAKWDRSSFYLATKMPLWSCKSLDDAKRIFEEQLQRLGVDYIDFYLLHSLHKARYEKAKAMGLVDWLWQQKAAGRIRNFGFSCHDNSAGFEYILRDQPWDFCQLQYNYLDRDDRAEEISGDRGYQLTEECGVPLIIMEPIKGGTLASLPADAAAPLHALRPDATDASWALRWVGSHKNVHVILSGMSAEDQLTDNLATFGHFEPLSPAENAAVESVANELHRRIKIGCTGCRYCMPCPMGVDIPDNFSIWNKLGMFGQKDAIKAQWTTRFPDSEKALHCVRCGKCEAVCPQKLPIRDSLAQLQKELDAL